MALLRDRISSPLEAGPSILDAQNLPSHLNEALEYVSRRLARKAMHINLVVVRRDYQVPSAVPPNATSPDLSPPTSPGPNSSRLAFATSSVAALKQLVRSNSQSSQGSNPISPLPEPESTNTKYWWPLSQNLPTSPPPMTPSTASSTVTDSGPMTPNPFGIRLIYANLLNSKEEKILRQTIEKAEKKFRIGTDWLPAAVNPSSCGLTNAIVRRSIIQNEILFSSEGLTLLSLDHLYSFKSAISSYSRTMSPMRLEDAVDELRRLVLSRAPGRLIPKSDVIHSYEWLGVTDVALADVDRMYRRAYGGPESAGALEGIGSPSDVEEIPEVVSPIKDDDDEEDQFISKAMMSFHIGLKPTPKLPVLKIQTTFDAPNTRIPEEDSAVEDGELTARPFSRAPGGPLWSPLSIDEVLTQDRGPHMLGPMTPNGYDDISPITRGEWGLLMVDGDGWGSAKRVVVETC